MAYTHKDLTKEFYTTGEVATIFNVNPKTIQHWDRNDILKFDRSPTNRRIMSKENLIKTLISKNMFFDNSINEKKDVIYARVSTQKQKITGDLDRQAEYILSNNKDLKNVVVLKEVGSGLNDNRKELNKLIDMILNDEVSRVFITYKERLTRFGFNYINKICKHMNVEVVVVHEKDNKSAGQELTEDMMSLLASFSGKLYGLRRNKNRKEQKSES